MAYRLAHCEEEPNYRYSLVVETDAKSTASLVVVQCNPSHASSSRSDPTVGKVSIWAEEMGFATISFLNLFARRSPTVSEISHLPYSDLIGPKNDTVLRRYSSMDATLVFAWGATLPVLGHLYERRLLEIQGIFAGQSVHRVGAMSSVRYPRHGRMWNNGNRALQPLSWSELLPNSSFKADAVGAA
ncbi:DUF1643 domain-containing protein [Pseudoduganella sp. LjRoot289]|uniref:DUF1643 domain-containing protein n=1 Tax=Pseudoduganella sp. LjRoot289 TaxID=3342314 RepID=UPI003F5050AF